MENKKYLEFIQRVIWDARIESRNKGDFKKIHDMMDIIENIPELLKEGEKIDDERLVIMVASFEEKYFNGQDKYSKILKNNL